MFEPEALSANTIETLAGHGGSDDNSALFILEAPNGTKPDGTVLVEVTVEEWNAPLGPHAQLAQRADHDAEGDVRLCRRLDD